MHLRRADGYDGCSYQDMEVRKAVFWMNFKKVIIKLLIAGAVIVAFAFYSINNPVPDAVRNVANVDRKEAAREAIELYSEAHPEFTEEEIEVIFRNVPH
jgi:hypothetical protein